MSRLGDVVLRSPGRQSRTVIALLQHLRANGCDFVPEPIGDGIASDGREQLRYIDGESPHPRPWSDDAVWKIGNMLRQVHDTTASFVPDGTASWRPSFTRSLVGDRPVIGHGDLGPWNIIARDGTPVAFIDWDDAGPVDAMLELAGVAWLNAQLHDDDVAALNGLGSPEDRARQLRLLVDGYGLARRDRAGFATRMIEFAIRSCREEAIACAVEPTTTSPAANGFPILWALTWRARAAAWMLDHQATLEAALA